jgi:sigma-E factor negative regulatory protein RseC
MEQVVRVTKTHDNGMATVLLVRESACSGDCHKCSGCGAAKETMIFEAMNPIGATTGDLVVIESETKSVMKAVGVFYALPLVLFFLGYYIGHVLEISGGLIGSLGFILAMCLAVVYDRKVAQKEQLIHTITGYAGDYLLRAVRKGDMEP